MMRQIFGKSDGDPANNNPVHVVFGRHDHGGRAEIDM